MQKTNFKRIILLSLLLSFSLLNGCGEAVKKHVVIEMKNMSSEEIHLWTSGESIDPSNKLASGASRINMIPWLQEDLTDLVTWVEVTVYAGRSGATITSKTFKVMVQETSSQTVVYSGGALSLAE